MKNLFVLFLIFSFSNAATLLAQLPEDIITESSEFDSFFFEDDDESSQPIDGVIEKRLIHERMILPYVVPREVDMFWERRIWRAVDTREKMNSIFMNENRFFFDILVEAAKSGKVRVYQDEKFKNKLQPFEVEGMLMDTTTTLVYDPDDPYAEPELQITANARYTAFTVYNFRVKEVWYFDSQTSTLKHRIIGIAPIVNDTRYNEATGETIELGSQALFWFYYPDLRKVLAREPVFNHFNDASPLSWDDIFEQRYFSSYIVKASNVFDKALNEFSSYQINDDDNEEVRLRKGIDRLLESEKIKAEIFNFEHDLWSY
jgi:gliding motility associated protien GldN